MDSSIFGYAANERAGDKYADANLLLRQIEKRIFEGYISDLVLFEIEEAPLRISNKLLGKIVPELIVLKRNREVVRIAEELTALGMFHENSFEDALHVSFAIINELDSVISYNFKHLVRLEVELKLHDYLSSKGLPLLYLNTPTEVIDYE